MQHRIVRLIRYCAEQLYFRRRRIRQHCERLVADASNTEREVLSAIRYQPNEAILHTDATLMPRRRRAWAAWNYHELEGHAGRATVTYNLSILQNQPTDTGIKVRPMPSIKIFT